MKNRALVLLCIGIAAAAMGQNTAKPVQEVTPVFHELVLFSVPATFQVTAPEHANQTAYLREIPLRGETVERWTQLITLTGAKDLALKPGVTPELLSQKIAAGYKSACPTTFAAKPVSEAKISGRNTFVALIGCGSTGDANGQPGAKHSEAAMVIVIQGASDFYTLQWAERGPAQDAPLKFDEAHWQERLKLMQPVKICTRVAGEKAPYASCLAQ